MTAAWENQNFYNDIVFRNFPRGCCGDTCYLLAEYLQSNGIETIYVCGMMQLQVQRQRQSHAWLVVKDHHISKPTPRFHNFKLPEETKSLLSIDFNTIYDDPICITRYEKTDLNNGIIIDITADQFGEVPVFVDYMDAFHTQFKFDFAHDHTGLESDARLSRLYITIMQYIS